jgi:hypothetical protein
MISTTIMRNKEDGPFAEKVDPIKRKGNVE